MFIDPAMRKTQILIAIEDGPLPLQTAAKLTWEPSVSL